MFYVTFNVPNPNFNLFGISKSQIKLQHTEKSRLSSNKISKLNGNKKQHKSNQNLDLSDDEFDKNKNEDMYYKQNSRNNEKSLSLNQFDKYNQGDLDEHIQLENIIKQSIDDKDLYGTSSRKKTKKKKELKFIGQSKKTLRDQRSEAVRKNIEEANKKLRSKYDDLMGTPKTPACPKHFNEEGDSSNTRYKKFLQGIKKQIDVGVFFENRNAKINDPIQNILRKQEIEKERRSQFKLTSTSTNPYNFETQAALINHKPISNLKIETGKITPINFNISSETELPQHLQIPTSPGLERLAASHRKQQQPFKIVPSVQVQELDTGRDVFDGQSDKSQTDAKSNRSHRSSKNLQLLLNNVERQNLVGVMEEPRSATLKLYDMYKKKQDQHTRRSPQRNSSTLSIKGTAQLIHDVVENIQRNSDAMQMLSTDEGNTKQLEQDLNKGFNFIKTSSLPELSEVQLAPNKLKKKFKKETVAKFKQNTFDLEKNELQAKYQQSKFS
eukprot:403331245